MTDADLERLATLNHLCCGNLMAMAEAHERANAEIEAPTFLVSGLIPRGAVTLLAGNRKIGKSALAMELCVAIAKGENKWLGFDIPATDPGFATYLLGEDSLAVTVDRVKRMLSGAIIPPALSIVPAGEADLDSTLNKLRALRTKLLVVDPARKFYVGDEDGSDPVNAFFAKLEAFILDTDATVLVTHHLKRGAHPKNVSDAAANLRGSGVWLDRPRVVLGMHRAGEETQLGIGAPDGQPLHNFPPGAMFEGVRRLRRDAATFRHVPIDSTASNAQATTAEVDAVHAAVERLSATGEIVTRTGPAGLFKRRPVETANLSRAAIDRVTKQMLASGQLSCSAAGALAVASKPARPSVFD